MSPILTSFPRTNVNHPPQKVFSISLAALGSLMWLRKNKPKKLIPIIYTCAGILATMPSITRKGLGWDFMNVVGFELGISLVIAFISMLHFAACQRPSA